LHWRHVSPCPTRSRSHQVHLQTQDGATPTTRRLPCGAPLRPSECPDKVIGHVVSSPLGKHHRLCDRWRPTTGWPWKLGCGPPGEVPCAGALASWQAPQASIPPRWLAPYGATIRRSATPSTLCLAVGSLPASLHPPARTRPTPPAMPPGAPGSRGSDTRVHAFAARRPGWGPWPWRSRSVARRG
jgi:hypothetical protein